MDPARGQLHDEEQVICHQSLAGPDLDRREVDSGQNLPVGLEKRCPRGLILPLGRRLDAVALQDVGYGPIRDDMPQIGQRPLNAIMAPTRILLRQPHDQLADFRRDRGPAYLLVSALAVIPLAIPLAGNEEAMPAQDSVRSAKGGDTGKESSTQVLALRGQSSALSVVESDAALSEGFAEDGILGAQVVDDLL